VICSGPGIQLDDFHLAPFRAEVTKNAMSSGAGRPVPFAAQVAKAPTT